MDFPRKTKAKEAGILLITEANGEVLICLMKSCECLPIRGFRLVEEAYPNAGEGMPVFTYEAESA